MNLRGEFLMDNLLSLFTYKELLIMGSVVGFLIFLIIVLVIWDLISRKQENVLEDVKEDYQKLEVEISNFEENVNEKIEIQTNPVPGDLELLIEEEKTIETSKVIDQLTEIEPLIMEIDVPSIVKIEKEEEKELNSQEKAQIELLKIEDELEHQPSLEDTITNLETIEEENAIISYQELLENTGELTNILEDDGDEPITIDEVFKLFNEENNEGLIVNEALNNLPIEEAYQGDFTSTPYLSPINGLENENLAEIQLENTANLEKLDKEIRKTNQFLNILNELKKNLE